MMGDDQEATDQVNARSGISYYDPNRIAGNVNPPLRLVCQH